jgi:hypothetical protein
MIGATYGAGAGGGGAATTGAGSRGSGAGGATTTGAAALGGTYWAIGAGPQNSAGGGGPYALCQHSPNAFLHTWVRELSTHVSRWSGGPKFCACAAPAAKPSTSAHGTTMRNEVFILVLAIKKLHKSALPDCWYDWQ